MLQIRTMTKEDAKLAAKLAADAFLEPWSCRGFLEALKCPHIRFFLAEEEGRIIGYAGLSVAFDEGEILSIAVCQTQRRRGVATALLAALLAEGERQGALRFFLEVRVSNEAAIRLYETYGFTKQGIRKNYYQATGEDAYIMNWIKQR